MKFLSPMLICAFSASALAAPPAATHLTVHASDIRQLQFDYEPVPGVARYELGFGRLPALNGSSTRRSARSAPLFRIGVSVHLLDWQQARYDVNACNPSGCTA